MAIATGEAGRVGWKAARTLRQLLALPRGEFSELEPHVPSFDPIIVDLSEAADDALRWR